MKYECEGGKKPHIFEDLPTYQRRHLSARKERWCIDKEKMMRKSGNGRNNGKDKAQRRKREKEREDPTFLPNGHAVVEGASGQNLSKLRMGP